MNRKRDLRLREQTKSVALDSSERPALSPRPFPGREPWYVAHDVVARQPNSGSRFNAIAELLFKR